MEEEEEEVSDTCSLGEEEKGPPKKNKQIVMEKKDFVCKFTIPFANHKCATMAYETLKVDLEISPEKIQRIMHVEGDYVICVIEATEKRLLKAACTSFLDMAMTAVRFLCEFDDL